uniref:Uncharacterized protein n=1 Tax=Trichogramma kaykai TaxID=54128 RepID=A0ABD2XFH3_9HYME
MHEHKRVRTRERFSARCATLYRTWVGRHRHRRETADSTRCCNAPREESQSMQNDNKSAATCHRPIPVAARTLTRLSFDEVHERNIQDACTRRRHILCSDESVGVAQAAKNQNENMSKVRCLRLGILCYAFYKTYVCVL